MSGIPEHVRICPFCKVRFKSQGNGCQRCKRDSFFSMRMGDIGTAMYLDGLGSDWKEQLPMIEESGETT